MIRPPDSGVASYFADRYGAWGNRLSRSELFCAIPDGSYGDRLEVCSDLACIVCTVRDIGPAKRLRRAIDLSPEAFRALTGGLAAGLVPVRIDWE